MLGLDDPPKKPSFDDQLRALYKPTMSETLRKMYESPLADSLYQTAPRPKQVGELQGGYTVRGAYDPYNGGAMHVADDGHDDPIETFKHEMGHAYLQDKNHPKVNGAMYDYPAQLEGGKSPLEQAAWGKLDEYGKRGGPGEAYANAYRQAFNFLSSTAKDPSDYRNKLGAIEGTNPGTGTIVKQLLQRDIFKEHPLRASLTDAVPPTPKHGRLWNAIWPER